MQRLRRKLKVPLDVARVAHPFAPLRALPGYAGDVACPCRRLSPGMYAVAAGCLRHDDGSSHFMCICHLVKNAPCLACDENRRRGLAASGLADGVRG